MQMDIAMQKVEKMRLEDPVRFNRLVMEGMAVELGIIGAMDKKSKSIESLKAELSIVDEGAPGGLSGHGAAELLTTLYSFRH